MKKVGLVSAAVVAAVVGVGVFAPHAYAAVQTCDWVGTGGDNKFSTIANWSNCNNAAPMAGDIVSFDASTPALDSSTDSNYFVNNDLGVSLGGVRVIGKSAWSGASGVILSSLKLTDGATITYVSDGANYKSLDLSVGNYVVDGNGATLTLGDLQGSGNLNIVMSGGVSNAVTPGFINMTGVTGLSVNGGTGLADIYISVMGSFSPTTVVLNHADIAFSSALTSSASFDITNGGLTASGYKGGDPYSVVLSGPIALHGDMQVVVNGSATLQLTGTITGGTITKGVGSDGTLIVGGTAVTPPVKTTSYDDSKPAEIISVAENETAVLGAAGVRSSVNVYQGGILKGTGTLQHNLFVFGGGIVAPGNSPGCITSDTLNLYGEYLVDLGGNTPCSGYDQLKVLNASASPIAVSLSNAFAVLTTSRYNGFTPKQGDVFVIIDQAGDKAVSGTFKGLPEGATFSQNGITFKISYVGGDGNDVTLTVMNQPTAPDTGVMILKSNPIAIVAGALVVAVALIGMAKFSKQRR